MVVVGSQGPYYNDVQYVSGPRWRQGFKPVMNEDVRALKRLFRKPKNTKHRIENSNRYFFEKVSE